MSRKPSFSVGMPGFFVYPLRPEDAGEVQELYGKCLDYCLIVDGHPAGNDAAEGIFKDVPPGKSLTDKFLWGIFDAQDRLVGLLDVVRDYPDQATWWIGLLLLEPGVRSRGLGEKVLEGFLDYMKVNGAREVMLGVVEENERAYLFWKKMGFALVRQTEPRQFGKKTHKVNVMRLTWQA